MAGLRGDQAFIDYTFIHFSGFSDAQNETWSTELCDLFGLDIDKLPEIVEPWRVIGQVTDHLADALAVGFAFSHAILGTPHLAGRNHLHRTRDLLRVLHAVDLGLDFFADCHNWCLVDA